MARRLAAGRARRTAIWTLFLLVAGLLLSTAGAVVAAPVAAPAAAHGSAGATHAAIPAHSARSSSAIHPALTTNGTVGQTYNSTKLPAAAHSNQPCYYDNYSFANYAYCFQQTQSPSIVSLANGDLGVGYSMETTVGLGCNATGGANLTSWTSTNVAWTLSSTNGTSWGAPQIIGNSTCQ